MRTTGSKKRLTLDDLVFENRNRSYGSYFIRATYLKRLFISFVIVLILCSLFLSGIYVTSINPINREYYSLRTLNTADLQYESRITPVYLKMPETPSVKKSDLIKISDEMKNKRSENKNVDTDVVKSRRKTLEEVRKNKDTEIAAQLNKLKRKTAESIAPLKQDTIILIVENPPLFPGGNTALQSYLNRNQRYPAHALSRGIQGKVIVSFLIKTDGTPDKIAIVKSVYPDLDMEAVRLVKNMPVWIPAKNHDENVTCMVVLPVDFSIKK